MKKVFLIILLFFLIVGCSNQKHSIEDDYAVLKGIHHVYEKVSYDEVVKALTSTEGSYVIFFAFDPKLYECPYCMAVITILNDAAIDMNVDKILYLDIYDMRMNYTSDYQLLVGYLDSKVGDLIVREDKKVLVVPDVYVVKDGQIMGHHIATIKNDEGKYIRDLTPDETEQLKDIYRDLFSKIK